MTYIFYLRNGSYTVDFNSDDAALDSVSRNSEVIRIEKVSHDNKGTTHSEEIYPLVTFGTLNMFHSRKKKQNDNS